MAGWWSSYNAAAGGPKRSGGRSGGSVSNRNRVCQWSVVASYASGTFTTCSGSMNVNTPSCGLCTEGFYFLGGFIFSLIQKINKNLVGPTRAEWDGEKIYISKTTYKNSSSLNSDQSAEGCFDSLLRGEKRCSMN